MLFSFSIFKLNWVALLQSLVAVTAPTTAPSAPATEDSLQHFLPVIEKYCTILETEPEQLIQTELYAFIDEWIGTPYRYGSNNRKGTDCSGFAGRLYEAVFDTTLHRSSAGIYTQVEPVEKEELQEGDLLFFKIRRGRISHVGVYLHNNYFVHASTSRGVIISNLEEPYYSRYFYKGGRLVQDNSAVVHETEEVDQ